MTLAEIKIPIQHALSGGKYNSFILDSIVQGYVPKSNDTHVIMQANLQQKQPTFEQLVDFVQDGVTWKNIILGIEIDSVAAAQQDVPEIIPGATYTEEEETITRSFIDWIKSFPTLQEIKRVDGKYYTKAAYGGNLLNSEQLRAIHVLPGISIIEWAVYAEKWADETGEIIEL